MCSVFLKDKLTGYFFHLIVLSKNMCGSSTLIASQKLRPLFIGVEKFTLIVEEYFDRLIVNAVLILESKKLQYVYMHEIELYSRASEFQKVSK